MQDRLRSAAARLAERAQRLRPGGDGVESRVDDADDDDPDADDLPQLGEADPIDAELAELDEAEAEPLEIHDRKTLIDMLHDVDPTPELPLTGPQT